MTKHIFYLIIAGLMFAQCSKKATETAMTEAEKPVTFRSSAPEPGPARAIKLGKAETFTLDNGLEVIVVENHKLPRVSYQMSLKHEALVEGENAGYVSMAGQLLNTGTTTKSKADIDKNVDLIGASFNTSASGFFASSLTKHQEKLLDVVTDVLYNPSFPQEEFEKIKKQTLSGLAQSKSDPNAMMSNVAGAILYGKDHAYGEIQTEETVENITVDMAKQYYDTYFRPNNAYLVIVGDITPAMAKKTAMKHFGQWEAQPIKPQHFKDVKKAEGRNVSFVNKDGAVQSVIRVTHTIDLKPGAPDAIASSVANGILGGGVFSGRLMQNLREDKAYTYGARSSLSRDAVVGNFNASASVRNEVTDSSVVEFLYELERMVNEPVSEEDLQLVKNYMTGSFARSLESPQTIARFALNTQKYDLAPDYYETYLQKLNAVTVEDVQAMAKKYIHPNNLHIVVVGNKDEVADKLKRFDADGKIDFYDHYANEVNYDAVMPTDVTAQSVIEDYITARGGKDAMTQVKTLVSKGSAEAMGSQISFNEWKKAPNLNAQKVSMGPMVLNHTVFDGTQLMTSQQGQKNVVTEGDEFDKAAIGSMFDELSYSSEDYAMELKGIEDVEGVSCYKLLVTDPNGEKSSQFYNTENGLLIRSSTTVEGPGGQSQTITTDFKDYKEVSGIKFPHTIVLIGVMPMPLEMKMDSIELNSEIDSSTFTIE